MKAIAAMSNNRVIGKDGRIPWRCKEDMSFFRRMTTGGTVVMGSTTFKSVGVLPDRYTFVLTRNVPEQKYFINQETGEYQVQFGSVQDLRGQEFSNAWVCGGAQTYSLLLHKCSDLYMTIILDDVEGSPERLVYMPDFEYLFVQQRVIVETKSFWIVHYWNITSDPHDESYREGFDAAWMGKTRRDNPWKTIRNEGFAKEQQVAWWEGWSAGANKKFELSISQIRI